MEAVKHLFSALPILALPIYLVVLGLLAYLGKDRNWAYRRGFAMPSRLGYFYLGVALICYLLVVPVTRLITDRSTQLVVGIILTVPAVICTLLGLVGLIWLPSFLLPKWYKDERTRKRAIAKEVAEANRDFDEFIARSDRERAQKSSVD